MTSGKQIVGERVRMKQPLVTHIYTADPSAHVFEGRVYVYPSHDLDVDTEPTDDGAHFDMRDYHVLSMDDLESPVIDHGPVLTLEQVPWASRQLWAPDAAHKNSTYYLFFPAKDEGGLFRIGVATGPTPIGPFTAQPEPIKGSYSIDPAVFIDRDGSAYLYFGGLWGGQLEGWSGTPNGEFDPNAKEPTSGPSLCPRVARLSSDLLSIEGAVREIVILDEHGVPLQAIDTHRRYFEGPWLHEHEGTYYFSYSTGDTHHLVYATSDDPLGPFTYRGELLTPPVGWTTHHSTVRVNDQWYLFYHDSTLSGGATSKRCVKVQPFQHEPDGSIRTMDP